MLFDDETDVSIQNIIRRESPVVLELTLPPWLRTRTSPDLTEPGIGGRGHLINMDYFCAAVGYGLHQRGLPGILRYFGQLNTNEGKYVMIDKGQTNWAVPLRVS